MRRGEYDEAELEEQLDKRGLMNRFFGRATQADHKPWQMYPLGVLFGLGFDTATEVALLATAGAAAPAGCRSTRSSACRSCSRPGCRCSTRSTARS